MAEEASAAEGGIYNLPLSFGQSGPSSGPHVWVANVETHLVTKINKLKKTAPVNLLHSYNIPFLQ